MMPSSVRMDMAPSAVSLSKPRAARSAAFDMLLSLAALVAFFIKSCPSDLPSDLPSERPSITPSSLLSVIPWP